MNPQLEGVERIEGTYVFDLRTSMRALRLNRFLWNLREESHREQFRKNEGEAMVAAKLSPEERAMVMQRDWLGLIRYGVNFFVLEKFARVVKMTNLEVYAEMRGESLTGFLKTRRVPDAR